MLLYIIQILVNAGVIIVLAKFLPTIEIKNYGTAIIAAILIGFLNAVIGWVLRLPLNIVTLGLLTFIVRVVVTAVMIKAVDKIMSDFSVQGFIPALIIAVILALVNLAFFSPASMPVTP